MTRIKRLINSYNKFISIPWRSDAAAAQRVIFCVYNEYEELRLRSKIKDRGKDVASAPWFGLFGGDRINDYNLTIEEKRAARKGKGGS